MFKADDYRLKIKALGATLEETAEALDIGGLTTQLAALKAEQEDPEVWQDLERSKKIGREVSSVESKIASYEKSKKAVDDVNEVIDLVEETGEEELVAELDGLIATAESDIEELRIRALLRGKYDNYNALLTLHSGAGGTESCDWVSMLYRMYCRYAEIMGWKVEIISESPTDNGGYKEVIALISGNRVYSHLKYESGTHRVQRVPATESQGRIHTSAATVAVMPEAEEVDVDIKPEDLRIDVYRASGAGGQHVNKTESAVRITHIPTGVVVTCQDEKSQHKNKARAMKVLASRILAAERERQHSQVAADRKSQVGSGDRSERIRTYNFPQGRVTDHRVNLTLYSLDRFMDGDLQNMIDALAAQAQAAALKAEAEGA